MTAGRISAFFSILTAFLLISGSCKTLPSNTRATRNLTVAILTENEQLIRQAMIEGADIDARTPDGRTHLHAAATCENPDIALLLIKLGCSKNERDRDGNTPLHYAIMNNRLHTAEVLIDRAGGIDLRNNEGRTPLHTAVLSLPGISKETPSAVPVKGNITSHFGLRKSPFGEEYEFHGGLDISSPEGAPVKAAAAGRVAKAGWFGGYGLTVIISHRFGFETMYGHCRSIRVSQGASVEKGQIIASVGSTGNTTGSHCHYEIRLNGSPINPYPYLNTSVGEKPNDIYSITRLLLSKKAVVNSRDSQKRTPLHDAVLRDIGTARLLVNTGADVNACDSTGQTPLHNAAAAGPEITSYLLEQGADPSAKTTADICSISGMLFPAGTTPGDVALRTGQTESYRILLRAISSR